MTLKNSIEAGVVTFTLASYEHCKLYIKINLPNCSENRKSNYSLNLSKTLMDAVLT
jgi:hypothetical protein